MPISNWKFDKLDTIHANMVEKSRQSLRREHRQRIFVPLISVYMGKLLARFGASSGLSSKAPV